MYRSRLAEALPRVRDRIAGAASRSGRDPCRVRIVAVTKGHPAEAVRAALEAGLEDVGENRIEELEGKRAAFDGEPRLRWHMVGHVQGRKAPRAREAAGVLHSLDSLKLAHRLERTAAGGAVSLPVLVQVNTSGEPAKHGFTPEECRAAFPELLELETLEVRGLMTMAPLTDDRETLRRTFCDLRRLHDELRERFPGYRGTELSMGMSNDYEIAVEEGSTLVRLGTILFGERPA
jgi:PLP dependent protein